MEESVSEQLAQYKAQTSRQKYMNNEPYNNFRAMLWVSLLRYLLNAVS